MKFEYTAGKGPIARGVAGAAVDLPHSNFMRSSFPGARAAVCALLMFAQSHAAGRPDGDTFAANGKSPEGSETFDFGIEWRLFSAGTAKLKSTPEGAKETVKWRSSLHLESAGVIAAFYKLTDQYDVHLEDGYCATSSVFSAQEGKRNRETRVAYDRAKGRATYVEKDLTKNAILHAGQTDTPVCVSDVVGALYRLRTMKVEPGQTVRLAISDGKKAAQVRVDARDREEVETKLGKFKTVHYDVNIFNGVLFSRRAQVEVWLSDDTRRLPVQVRVHLPIVIGTITLQLEKEEKS